MITEKLMAIQAELKAPKGQYNSFGKYKYRSCEDILEAAKPVCAKNGCALVVADDIQMIGERFYVKATARLIDIADGAEVTATAFAREPNEKKGMDDSQITGTASSYARKYALNGLFCIDDTKDADTDENRNERDARASKSKAPDPVDIPPKTMCEMCHNEILDVVGKNGKPFTVRDIVLRGMKDHDGKILCAKCQTELAKNKR